MAELPFLDESTAAAPSVPFSGITGLGSGPAPLPYTGTADANSFELKSNKGSPNGYAPLDASSKVPLANLPDQASLDAEVAAAVSAHNALTTSVHGISDTANLELVTNKNTANGYAGLGADGKISLSLLPEANALESEAIAFAIALG